MIRSGLLLLLLLTGEAIAAPPANSPEGVVLAYITAIQKDGPAATVPRFTHPDECARFKAIFMPAIRADAGKSSVKTLGRKMSLKEIEDMRPVDFLTAYLESKDLRVDGLKLSPPKFLGSVREGEILHLLVRTEKIQLDGLPSNKVDVLSLKPFGNSWKLMLSWEFEAYARALAAQ